MNAWKDANLCLTCASSEFTQNPVMWQLPAGLCRGVGLLICALQCAISRSTTATLLSCSGGANRQLNPILILRKWKIIHVSALWKFGVVSWPIGLVHSVYLIYTNRNLFRAAHDINLITTLQSWFSFFWDDSCSTRWVLKLFWKHALKYFRRLACKALKAVGQTFPLLLKPCN